MKNRALKPILAMIFLSGQAMAQGQTVTTVTTYVTDTQQKRESTRFTLTEWLRIKERMKMMDVWLAMFSKPESKFEPELFVGYQFKKGAFRFAASPQPSATSFDTQGEQGKVQLWLTNLISSSTGIRTLNVDFGVEGVSNSTAKVTGRLPAGGLSPGRRLTTQATADFRLFGKNIQDSYFVLKCGSYTTRDQESPAKLPVKSASGTVAGSELGLYVFKWLGIGGSYFVYGTDSSLSPAHTRGSYFDYQAFLEISVLRLMAGHYQENFTATENGSDIKTVDAGQIFGVQLLF